MSDASPSDAFGFNFSGYGDEDDDDEDEHSQLNDDDEDQEFKQDDDDDDDDDHDQDEVKDLEAMSLPHLTALHENTASINFPMMEHSRNFSRPTFHGTQKSNTYSRAPVPIAEGGNFAVDRSLSVANHDTVSFNDTQTDNEAVPPAPRSRLRKLRTQGTKRDVNVRFLRNDDPNLDTKSEWEQIKKDGLGDIDDRKILTTDDLRETLQADHMVVHISTHGVHAYPNVRRDRENEFQIMFQESSIIRYMLEEHRCSAYYAAIAIIFEMELNKFVQCGFSRSKSRRDRLKTWIWKQSPKYTLLENQRIYALFVAICHRFGCDCEFDARIVHIYWGRRGTVREKPHPPMAAYQFVTMFKDDANVQGVLQQIEEQYNRHIVSSTNSKIVSKLKEFQQFCWEIMCVLLQRLLTNNRAEPEEHLDDTKWIEDDAADDTQTQSEHADGYEEEDDDEDGHEEAAEDNNNNEDGDGGGGGDGDDEWAAFFGNDNNMEDEHDNKTDKRTAVKILTNQNSTREIKIVPTMNNMDRQALDQDPKAQERLARILRRHADKVVTSLKKQTDIQIVFDSKSHTACNVHIVRFANSMSIELATKKINHWKEKLNSDYDIVFREISHADKGTQHEVGYIRAMQDKVVNIDIKRNRDAIAQMLKKRLTNKRECPIKLVVLNGCHSYILGQMFSDYVESVICVQPYVKIFDATANVFAREFYDHFRKNLGPHRLMSHTVLMAYDMAKKCVAKECGKDIQCVSHSHLHAFESAPNYEAAVKQFSASHHDLQWKKLQQTIEHEQLFAEYSRSHHHHNPHHRNHDMHHHDDHGAFNAHDGNTLIVSNLSSQQEMFEIIQYLEDYADDFLYPAAKGKPEPPSTKTDFVKRSQFCVDSNYKQFSYAYLNFASSRHCDVAMKILDRKRDDEALLVSDRWVKNLPATMPMRMPSHASDDSKDEAVFYKSFSADIADMNLAWIHRRVPRCCCAPHHPHLTQDKLILIQNGQIMNRSIVSNMQVISNGLKQSKHREQQRQQQKRHQRMPSTPQHCFESPSASTSTSFEEKQDSVSPTSPTSVQATTSNNFQLYAKPKKNSFGGAPKPKRRNNFPSVSTQQSSNFDTPPPRRKTNFQLQVMDENDGDGSNTPSPTTIPKQQIEQKSNFGVVETKERKNKF